MGRRQGDRTRNRLQPEGRTAIWKAMRFMKTFDLEELGQASGSGQGNCQRYTLQLLKAGYLRLVQQADGRPGKPNRYRLIRDTGHRCPMPQKDGTVFDPNLNETFEAEEPAVVTGRQRAWEVMRRGDFTVEHLARVMSESGARVYVRGLHRAGYLIRLSHGAGYYRYRLVQNTGSKAPVLKRTGEILDLNLLCEGDSDEQSDQRCLRSEDFTT